jgi:hypothetical protein
MTHWKHDPKEETMTHKKAFDGRLAALAVFAGAAIGYAAIPGAGGVITVCYNTGSNPSGQQRVINAEAGITSVTARTGSARR